MYLYKDIEMIVIMFGPPGSGKGTQAQKLSKDLNLVHISTGDILRKAISGGTDLGNKVKDIVEKGGLVPDELVSKVMFERLEKEGVEKGFILDGYPRTLGQAYALDDFLKNENNKVDSVIYLDTPEEKLIKRISNRYICSKCGENQIVRDSKSEEKFNCAKCGAPLLQRKDDRINVTQERLKNYYSQTTPLLDYYKKRGILKEVDGEGEISDVFLRLLKVVACV